MTLKVINQAAEVLFENVGKNLSKENEEKIETFKEKPLESITITVNEDIKMGDADSIEELIDKDGIKEVIMKLKD